MLQMKKTFGLLSQADGASLFGKELRRKTKRLFHLVASGLPYFTQFAKLKPLVGMTMAEERAYLQDYAKNEYSGRGEIVELGCWLGSSTIPLAMGLEKNPKDQAEGRRIHVYDIFTWHPAMEECAIGTPLEGKYEPGDNFIEEYLAAIRPWQDLIEVRAGDLTQIGWEGEKQIEFLFNDASKSWELANSILQNFYPALIPGVSLCAEQDFGHYYTSWVHLIRYRLREYFEPVCHVPFSGTVVFRYLKKVPADILQQSYSFNSFSEEEIEEAFNYSMGLVSRELQPNVAAAKVMLFIHAGDRARAWQEFTKAKELGFYEQDLVVLKNTYFAEA